MKAKRNTFRATPLVAEVLGRVVDIVAADPNISFRAMAEAAGLDPARDFIGASLINVDFRDEDLSGFNFANADLTGADFRGANIAGAIFEGAILTGIIVPPETKSLDTERSSRPQRRPRRYYVSYAWGDERSDRGGPGTTVDRLCEEAERRGIRIIRDKTELHTGESISKFMVRLAGGDRIFIILSDRYLRSTNCMCELLEIWKRCKAQENRFLARIRVYALPGTEIYTVLDRAKYATHWQEQYDLICDLINRNGLNVIGTRGFRQSKMMPEFAHEVTDILEMIADRLQPQNFNELLKWGLDDLPTMK